MIIRVSSRSSVAKTHFGSLRIGPELGSRGAHSHRGQWLRSGAGAGFALGGRGCGTGPGARGPGQTELAGEAVDQRLEVARSGGGGQRHHLLQRGASRGLLFIEDPQEHEILPRLTERPAAHQEIEGLGGALDHPRDLHFAQAWLAG